MFKPPDTHRQGISYKQYFFAAVLIFMFQEILDTNNKYIGLVNFKGY
jgi:hypothetical protein